MKPTVLALDDEPEILSLLSTALGREGFHVLLAETIESFRVQNAAEDVDVYLVDITLPDGNGFALIKELRLGTDKGLIILSGRSDETDHVLGLEIGADDYVNKPFRVRELCSRVNAVYRRTRRDTKPDPTGRPAMAPENSRAVTVAETVDFEFDGFRLRLASRRLTGPDEIEIQLTTAEFELLAGLLGRRGQVLSRDQLMNTIKGRDWESYDRAVDGLVSRLRRKLDTGNGKSSYIRTVHGIGYSFVG